MRLEIIYNRKDFDARARRLLGRIRQLRPELWSLGIVDVLLLNGIENLKAEDAERLFADRVAQKVFADNPALERGFEQNWCLALEVTAKPGVTDPVAITARQTIESFLRRPIQDTATVQTAKQYVLTCSDGTVPELKALIPRFFNELIENAESITRTEWLTGKRFPASYPHTVPPSPDTVEAVPILTLGDGELTVLSKKRLLALSVEEMRAVQGYFADHIVKTERKKAGLPEEPTDVELEMIAQTWSEHCKHKIFQANITYIDTAFKNEAPEKKSVGNGPDGENKAAGNNPVNPVQKEEIRSLFKTYIRGTTETLSHSRPDLCSVFTDNSGVVRFDDETCVCFKVETHNSPSALDPYGGAITGIVGVNRDILGTGKGAKPIFNTNVLCFGHPDTVSSRIPPGLLHPRQVMEGVHRGIIDGGNQSGIPVAAGAFLFDESYLGKPLVFCGTGGIMPAEINGEACWIKHIDPGDRAVMLGGRIGKDGIHGATFSSEALTETSPTSAVQIGDPIIQKKMTDFLLEARNLGLYKGITDNGAGGLSSSLGEMAEASGGVRIFLNQCPLKYQGLAPWEILVSESQERMSLAVSDDTLPAFMDLARRRDVEAAVVGEFTDSGLAEIFYKDAEVGRLSLDFLHNGLPVMELSAVWPGVKSVLQGTRTPPADHADWTDTLRALLAEPNIASKESLVRQYDHEVQAHSVVKPFCGPEASGPTDGGVLRPVHTSFRGLTVTHGICPRYGDIDTYHMSVCAVDEAYRAHIGMGGNPALASALDNFCWPDPVVSSVTPDGEYKLAQLVRACKGLKDACLAYGIPLISGKDSMKNDASIGGKKVSVRPTLLVSLMGIIDDVRRAITTDFKTAGDLIYVLGATNGELGGTAFEKVALFGGRRGDNAALAGNQTGSGIRDVGAIEDVPGCYDHLGPCPAADLEAARHLYATLSAWIAAEGLASCHDCSDGGLAVAIAESAIAGGLGCDVDVGGLPGSINGDSEEGAGITGDGRLSSAQVLFCESPSRFVVSITPEKRKDFELFFKGRPCKRIGEVKGGKVNIGINGVPAVNASLENLKSAWQGRFA